MAGAAVMATLLFTGDPSQARSGSATAGETHDDNLIASVAAGGRLYDNWLRELAKRRPKTPHPLYPSASERYADEPWETWRCVVCHGWDYRGVDGVFHTGPSFTGAKGIDRLDGRPVGEIIEAITAPEHGFADMFDTQSLLDLALFVSKGQVVMDEVIDPMTRRARANPGRTSMFFSTICVNCHGPDGRQMRTIPPVGDVARSDPWLALHKMLNGHPGDDMPALRAFGLPTVLSTLAYTQSLPGHDQLASVARGGKLYDDWAGEIDRHYPPDPHPAYPAGQKVMVGSSTWRCVECHGWDYRGAAGVRGIRNMTGAHPAAIVKVLTDDLHHMDDYMRYKDLTDLAAFVSQGQVEMNEYIDPVTKKARGESEEHPEFFLTLCATCHGEDGTAIRTMPPLGRVADENPWKVLHRMFHGHPGEYMPAWQATMPPATARNVLSKVQTLKTKR